MASYNSVETLVPYLKQCNTAYRKGKPLISDMDYDELVEKLRKLDPKHPFLHEVEAETLTKGQTVRHRIPMLSLEKAYTVEQLQRFIDRISKASEEVKRPMPTIRVTPKLDGMAGRDENDVLASRGNGLVGNNNTHIFKRGVRAIGGRNQGLGEIVMVLSYFNENFSEEFTHPRNMVTGCVNADDVNASTQKALDDGKIHFLPYSELAKTASWEGSAEEFLDTHETITQNLAKKTDYPLDGMVAEATDPIIQQHMGSTSHHNRWQIAIKTRGETAITTIESIGWQTGRTGVVTPVLRVKPTKLSGATISNITAHHAGMVRDKKLGVGAKIEIIRSGEVIPKLEKVIEEPPKVNLISNCPSCEQKLTWDGDFLRCTNHDACPAQTHTGLFYWFRTLGSADGFGPKSIEKIVDGGYNNLKKIYGMKKKNFQDLGFGDKQSENLEAALRTSQTTTVEDARFLAAFGIPNLGIGDGRKLLANFKISELDQVTEEKLEAIKGFGKKTSKSIAQALKERWPTIKHIYDLGFSLEETTLASEKKEIISPISGKAVLFTGTMKHGKRSEMQAEARDLGARVLSSVSKKLEILVIGEEPSQSKVNKAKKYGIQVMAEADYLKLIKTK